MAVGNDSINYERSLWIRNAIADIILEECRCELYNGNANCVRCDNLRRADRLWPVEYAKAVENVQLWQLGGQA